LIFEHQIFRIWVIGSPTGAVVIKAIPQPQVAIAPRRKAQEVIIMAIARPPERLI
jgi:hypothetical protein